MKMKKRKRKEKDVSPCSEGRAALRAVKTAYEAAAERLKTGGAGWPDYFRVRLSRRVDLSINGERLYVAAKVPVVLPYPYLLLLFTWTSKRYNRMKVTPMGPATQSEFMAMYNKGIRQAHAAFKRVEYTWDASQGGKWMLVRHAECVEEPPKKARK